MGYSEYCQILLLLGQQPVSQWFFSAVLGGPISKVSDYEKSVRQFRIIAARRFGNFKYAFKFFAGIRLPKTEAGLGLEENPSDTWENMTRNPRYIEDEFKDRPKPPIMLQDIPKENRFYVSELNKPEESDPDYSTAVATLKIAKRNTIAYLSSDFIDVYIATSMRTKKQFTHVAEIIEETFNYDELSGLNLRFFDPTSSEGRGRISKSLIEALMLKRAKVALYLAQESDSLGKDSELATMLVQGKDVVVLVPQIDIERRQQELSTPGRSSEQLDEDLIYFKKIAIEVLGDRKKSSEDKAFAKEVLGNSTLNMEKISKLVKMEQAFYEKRARILKEGHPLGLQVNLSTGVANGVIVVRSPLEAAKMLRASLLNSHQYELLPPTTAAPFWNLCEAETQSVVRVVSTDNFLTKAFWSNYIEMAPLFPTGPQIKSKKAIANG